MRCMYCGADDHNHNQCSDPTPPRRRRIVLEEGCQTCAEIAQGGFGPSHDPSPRCESGKRPHCVCDVCF